jgi:hypothetical protein
MKNSISIIGALFVVCTAAHAEVACEAVKAEQPGKTVLRGIRVTNLGKLHVQHTLFGQEKAIRYFDSDPNARDRAFRLCQEILSATRCDARTPERNDQYVNLGDPGYGPAMREKDSTEAATLSVGGLSKEIEKRLGKSLASRDGEYFKYYSGCEEFRAELAFSLLKILKSEHTAKNAPANEDHYEPVPIYEKF